MREAIKLAADDPPLFDWLLRQLGRIIEGRTDLEPMPEPTPAKPPTRPKRRSAR